jgi:hypothetical protein
MAHSALTGICAIAREMADMYAAKCANDKLCQQMYLSVAAICSMLIKRFDSSATLTAEHQDQIAMVEASVRRASEWMTRYTKKSALAKFFKSQSEQRKWLTVKVGLDDALRTLGMDQQVVIEQLGNKCAAMLDALQQAMCQSQSMSLGSDAWAATLPAVAGVPLDAPCPMGLPVSSGAPLPAAPSGPTPLAVPTGLPPAAQAPVLMGSAVVGGAPPLAVTSNSRPEHGMAWHGMAWHGMA